MQTLIETILFEPQLIEDGNNDGILRIKGVFQRAGVKNANGRVYSRGLWEKVLKKGSPVMEKISERAMIGHLEHPSDGVTDLRKGALVITNIELDEKNQIVGTAELLDTPDGLIAQEYVKKKIRIGISSRGAGSVGSNGEVSESDYRLDTFDLVYNPSTPGAHPSPVQEGDGKPTPALPATPKMKESQMSHESITKFQGLEREIITFVEQDMTGLLPYQMTEVGGKLLEYSVQLGALSVENPAMKSVIDGLQEQVSTKRKEIQGIASPDANKGKTKEPVVAPVVEDAGDDEDLDDSELQEGLAEIDVDSILESGDEDEDEEGEEDDDAEMNEDEDNAPAQLYEAMRDRIFELEAENEILIAEKEAAAALLAEMTADSKATEIAEAIRAQVLKNPALKEAIELMAECTSVKEVEEKAKSILSVLAHDENADLDDIIEAMSSDDEDEDSADDEDEEDEEDDEEDEEEKGTNESRRSSDDIFESVLNEASGNVKGKGKGTSSEDDAGSTAPTRQLSEKASKGVGLARRALGIING